MSGLRAVDRGSDREDGEGAGGRGWEQCGFL